MLCHAGDSSSVSSVPNTMGYFTKCCYFMPFPTGGFRAGCGALAFPSHLSGLSEGAVLTTGCSAP